MPEIDEKDERRYRFPGRKLGSSWIDWDGNVERHESYIQESPSLYLVFLFALLIIVSQVLLLDIFYLTQFAFAKIPLLQAAVFLLIGTPLVGWWLAFILCLLALATRKPALSFPWLCRWLTLQAPFLSFCARPFGVSRDRIGSSCIAVTNALARLQLNKLPAFRPLLLLPRCLSPDMIRSIRALAEPWQCPVAVVAANRKAREKVHEHKPTAIIAIACERDLVHGLYDYGHKLPILVLPNRRPFGPCLKSEVDLEDLADTLDHFFRHDLRGIQEKSPC